MLRTVTSETGFIQFKYPFLNHCYFQTLILKYISLFTGKIEEWKDFVLWYIRTS